MILPAADDILKLIILFFVIFDPFASFSVFTAATANLTFRQRRRTALLAVLVASLISYSVLFFGESVLRLFGAEIHDFKIAAGIILCILGIKMSLGESFSKDEGIEESSSQAIAALIGTPLLTGPAAITTIIIVVQDYGLAAPALAVTLVLLFTTALFLASALLARFINTTLIRVLSTILGLITISWGIKFIRAGISL